MDLNIGDTVIIHSQEYRVQGLNETKVWVWKGEEMVSYERSEVERKV